jgi:acyl-CoA reductase-like NAD-dependent aldehyde dehydrogenase
MNEAVPVNVRMHVGGEWVDSANGEFTELTSPVDGKVRALVADGDRDDARAAVAAAVAAKRNMAALPVDERAGLCRATAEVIERRRDLLAETLSLEQGKPLSEARAEVAFAAQLFRDAGGAISQLASEILPGRDPGKRILTLRQPHGVVGVITPWNFPMGIPSEYLSAALVTGNTVVWKPAPTTPHAAAVLLECMIAAGLPAGAVNIVHGGAEVGDEIVTNRGVQAIGFTGSAQVGEIVAQRAGAKPLLLELGGNGPTVILDDADLERAIPAVAEACYLNAGQICQSSERILVGRRIHDAVVDGLVKEASRFRLGHPLESSTTMGPLNNEGVAAKMDEHVADGVARGAVVMSGGRRADGFPTRLYYEPTVLDGVTPDSLLNLEETFGPVAPVLTVEDVDEAIALANSCELGLCGAVFSRDTATALYCAEQLECGVVNINEHAAYWDGRTPFGGFSGKRSGVGRLGGMATLLSLTQLKSVVLDMSGPQSAGRRPRPAAPGGSGA